MTTVSPITPAPVIDPTFASLRAAHLYVAVGSGTLSYLLNGLVIYLARTTKWNGKEYSGVVTMNALGDLIYNTMHMITFLTVEVRQGRMYFVLAGPFQHVPNPWTMVLTAMWLSGMYVIVTSVVMQFLYRYNVMCMERKWTSFEFGAIYALTLAFCFFYGFLGFFAFSQMDEEKRQLLAEHPMYTWDTPSFTYGDTRDLLATLHFTGSQLALILSYGVVIHTGRKISAKLNESVQVMSKRSLRGQKRLSQMMVVQAIYPAVIVGTPIMVNILCAQLRIDHNLTGFVGVLMLDSIPIVNSLTVLCMIRAFRRRLRRLVLVRVRKSEPLFQTSTSAALHSSRLKPTTTTVEPSHAFRRPAVNVHQVLAF